MPCGECSALVPWHWGSGEGISLSFRENRRQQLKTGVHSNGSHELLQQALRLPACRSGEWAARLRWEVSQSLMLGKGSSLMGWCPSGWSLVEGKREQESFVFSEVLAGRVLELQHKGMVSHCLLVAFLRKWALPTLSKQTGPQQMKIWEGKSITFILLTETMQNASHKS